MDKIKAEYIYDLILRSMNNPNPACKECGGWGFRIIRNLDGTPSSQEQCDACEGTGYKREG
jgi:excinuclease UvrABC ATPase subunit